MNHRTLLSGGLALLLGAAAQPGKAQPQTATPVNGAAGAVQAFQLTAYGGTNGCGPYQFNLATPGSAWNTNYGPVSSYFSLPAGDGPQSFEVVFNYRTSAAAPAPTYQVWVDGALCAGCNAQVTGHIQDFDLDFDYDTYNDYVTINHQAGDAWAAPNNGVREFGLRISMGGQPQADLRFKAVMVGTTFSEVLGHYDAPAVPLYILRDPPGDASYSSITIDNGTCLGQTHSSTTGSTQNGYFKGRIGVSGTIGLVVTTDYEIYGEVGTDITTSRTETATREYQTCLSTSSEVSTPQTGPPDDVFLGSAIRYAYGMGQIITRTTCGTIEKTADFASVPVNVLSSYNYTESYIRETIMPQIASVIATLTPGTDDYDNAVEQLSVWQQTLDMNDEIKAEAAVDVTRNFSGGGNGETHTLTSTTTQTKTIEFSSSLDNGLNFEFGVNIGGTGITAGGDMHFQSGYGSTTGSTNTSTNTMTYHLQDENGSDNYSVKVAKDPVFGTYVFVLDSAASATSCSYEGGYQIDQPSLSVGTPGNTTMVVNEAPLGSQVNFPLYVCNNSNADRTYYLKFSSATNTEGGILTAFGNTMNGNDDGIELEVPAGDCLSVTNLILEENGGVVDYEDILVYLYSLCDGSITSSVTISAYFGDGNGNFGDYCTPPSYGDIIYGNWIDGVQIGAINNTGTGGTPPPDSHVDYSGSFSTDLSLNSQQMLTITPGTGGAVRCAAWIDYDHSGTFDEDEKLGEFTGGGQVAQDIAFTVPVSAALGTTRMRVRGGYVFTGSEPDPFDACYAYAYSEIEDYAIVINDDTPMDCTGAPNGPALPGSACDDGNATTGNDAWNANCACVGIALDCAGTPGGTAYPGTACDDGNANTASDVYDANCTCAGMIYDCNGVAGGPSTPGTPCDDGLAQTGDDMYDPQCLCVGMVLDCEGTPAGTVLPGTACDDGNALSFDDVYDAVCQCAGQLATDCNGTVGGPAQPGTVCDDGNMGTGNDVYGPNCVCAGQPYDCAGTPGGTQLPGSPCDDGNPDTENDTFDANCGCLGVAPQDCEGVPGGGAQPGTACDDDDATTGNDVYNAFCICAGQIIDCDGVAGGLALPGFPCDDADATTGNDVLDNNCACAGQPYDCEGIPGGTNTVGTACDDGNANTGDDIYNAACICAGLLANDCEGVAGGPAQPGTACDDGDTGTGNDVYQTDCQCAGTIIDCEGTIGGTALPGTPCDDGVACTANDVLSADCVCSGTTITIGAVSGATTVFGNTTNAYVVTPIPNATGYTWTLPNGWTTGDNSAFVIVADVNNTPGDVELCVTATVGACELTSCITVTVDFNTGIATSNATSTEWFTVQPNPSNGMFQLLPSTTVAEPIQVSVRNGLGQDVVAPFTVAGERAIGMDLGNMASGAYYLLVTRNGEQHVMKLMVQR